MRRLGELFRLDGRVGVITGGAGHIGLAFGEVLAENGARIVVVDRDARACDERAATLVAQGAPGAIGVALDLADPLNAERIVARTIDHFGGIDIMIHNAAYTGASNLGGFAVPFSEQSFEAWDAALRVNLGPAFLLTQKASGALAASGHGVVVNVASIYGLVGPDFRMYAGTSMGNPAAYAASKGGLLQLTRYLATALAPRVRVNAISPGGIARGQNAAFVRAYESRCPAGRMGTEEDLKGALAYLVSDASAYVTGQNLVVDGGWTAW